MAVKYFIILGPGPYVIKPQFTYAKARVFVIGGPLHPSLMFASEDKLKATPLGWDPD